MNERIKELAEQASGFVDLTQHVGGDKGCMVYTHDGLEKFARLIVKECIVTVQCAIIRNGNTPENQRSYKHVGDIADKFNIKLPIEY